MELIRHLSNIKDKHRGAILSIGNFDGVHLGHQTLLRELIAVSKKANCPSMIMIFEPQPLEFFQKQAAPARITPFRDKCRYLAKTGVDYVLVIPFNNAFSQLHAPEFIEHILIEKLAINGLFIGEDFHFGRQRQGNFALIDHYAKKGHFTMYQMPNVTISAQRVSSTLVRETLANSDFEQAAQYLGRPYSISGRVIHGQKLARTLGAPTANLRFNVLNSPLNGVFAVKATVNKRDFFGVANLGFRPTIAGKTFALEVHLFGNHANLYGYHIEVTFFKKMRGEMKFDSLDALKKHIAQDIIDTKRFFDLPIELKDVNSVCEPLNNTEKL